MLETVVSVLLWLRCLLPLVYFCLLNVVSESTADALEKSVTAMFPRNYACRKCVRNAGEAVEPEDKVCDEVEAVRKLTYLGGRLSAGGGYEAAVTARTRCGWVEYRECVELLSLRRFSLRLK